MTTNTEPTSHGRATHTAHALRNLKARMRTRAANLLDPNYGLEREFPEWQPAMSTADYIKAFQRANRGDPLYRKHCDEVPMLTFKVGA